MQIYISSINIGYANWLIIIEKMILEITGTTPKPIPKRAGWKQMFRQDLYKRNKQQIRKHKQSLPKQWAQHHRDAEHILQSLFQKDHITLKDTCQSSACHSYYSSYIPIKMQCKFDDELTNTFPYIRLLNEKGRNNDKNLILLEIAEYMKNSKQKGEVDIGWQTCLNKYLCGIDSLQAIQLFLQLKKSGTSILNSMHSRFGGKCLQNIFFERVKSSSIYFKRLVVLSKSPFSLQAHQQINQITMAKTMKQMFCSICLIYDCTQHSLDNIILEKQCHYLAPINIRSQKENLKNAIGICMAYRQLLENGSIEIVQPCSRKCFKYLNTKSWEDLQINRTRLFSPTVKGIIKLGIQMFSYSPCEIWFLASSEKIYCEQIFFYFIEEFNITARLQKKMMQSQVQVLTRQRQIQENRMPQLLKKTKKKLKLHNIEPTYSSSTCCHFYIGEIPEDLSCENCSCRERGYCLPQCLCDLGCPIRKRGCNCKKQQCKTKKCICFSSNAQCDPQVCSNCFGEGATKKSSCKNHAILSNSFKKTRVGRSTIPGAGLGLYAGQPIKKNELLMIYSGQLIEHSIDILRESLSVDNSFYNFGSPQGTIDARYMGNCSRFINHADLGKQNLFSQNIFTQGRCKIGFYAIRDIDKDEQLFFDYDGEGKLYQNYKDKYPFIKQKKWGKI